MNRARIVADSTAVLLSRAAARRRVRSAMHTRRAARGESRRDLRVAEEAKRNAAQLPQSLCARGGGAREQPGLAERARPSEEGPRAGRNHDRDKSEDDYGRWHLRAPAAPNGLSLFGRTTRLRRPRWCGEDRERAQAAGTLARQVAEWHPRERRVGEERKQEEIGEQAAPAE